MKASKKLLAQLFIDEMLSTSDADKNISFFYLERMNAFTHLPIGTAIWFIDDSVAVYGNGVGTYFTDRQAFFTYMRQVEKFFADPVKKLLYDSFEWEAKK